MTVRRRVTGGLLVLTGFLLSPLSWWNDLFVNVPLALAAAWCVGLLYKPAFTISFVVAYWLTNIIGLVLLQKGIQRSVSGETDLYTRRALLKDLAISLFYTLLILLLIKTKVIEPLPDLFVSRYG